MKVILLGKQGMLGSMIHFLGCNTDIVALGRSEFDANMDVSTLTKYIEDGECCIVNCIGAIPQKKPTDEVYRALNQEFPHRLADFCASHNLPLIHISTNCVFSGACSYMTENDLPEATDFYGRSKLLGEPLGRAVVLRCSIIGFERVGSHFGLLEWYCNAKETVHGYKDHMWNGLTTLELAKTILDIVAARAFTPRLEHHYSENTLSKYDILGIIAKYIPAPPLVIGIDAGVRHVTLKSIYENTKHPNIESQIAELFSIRDKYKLHTITATQ